jgi:FMN phosphatase YigB (HAD superfamily)
MHTSCPLQLFGIMMKQSTILDKNVVNAIKKLRESGKFKLAALTNNFSPPQTVGGGASGKKAPSLEEELEHLGLGKGTKVVRELFDHYIESAVVGMRKPEEGFYKYALDLLGAGPEEVVFLDDIGM